MSSNTTLAPSETSATTQHAEPSSDELQALYLLGFSSGLLHGGKLDIEATRMLDLLEIESMAAGRAIAWFKKIERSDFEGDQGEKNLADIQWLTPRVIAHERVVSCLSKQFTFYPARFGTLFSSEKKLEAFTRSSADTLFGFFKTVGQRLEWGLKFYGDTSRAAQILAQRDGMIENGKPVGGANYLKLRQMQRERSFSTQKVLSDGHVVALRSLESLFHSIVVRNVVNGKNEASKDELICNLAILVDQAESEQLLHWTDQWNQDQASQWGLRVEISGPWPAYSFCPSLSPNQSTDIAPNQSMRAA